MKVQHVLLFPVLALTLLSVFANSQQAPKYRVVQHFVVGGDGGWDYVTFDAEGNRLFIARSTRVMVVDATSGKPTGEIPDTPGVHEIVLVPGSDRGFVSVGRAGEVVAFDVHSLKKVGEIKAGENPDAIIYDPSSQQVVVMNGRSKDVMFIDPAKMKVTGTIPVGGNPEYAVADGHGRVYVNIEDTNEIVALDSQKMSVIARWPLTGCESPTGLAIDTANQRLFSVCDKALVISDAKAHKTLKTLTIGARPDGVVYDPQLKTIISSNGEGTLSVVQQRSADEYSQPATVPTATGARTIALDAKTHRLYLITAKFGPPPPSIGGARVRPPMLPGTFEVIVCEPEE